MVSAMDALKVQAFPDLPPGLLPNLDFFIAWDYLWFLFKNISPYFWAAMGIGLCVGLSILGAAWWVQTA